MNSSIQRNRDKKLLVLSLGFVLASSLQPAAAAESSWSTLLKDTLAKGESLKDSIQGSLSNINIFGRRNSSEEVPQTESSSQNGAIRGKNFTLSTTVTSDSSVRLEGFAPQGSARLLITFTLNNDSWPLSQEAFPLYGQMQFSRTIYLRAGAGKYRLNLFSCPEMTGICYQADSFEILNTDTEDHSFLLPSLNVESDAPEIISLASQITAGLRTDREKSRAIHDWVARNIAYDVDSYFDGSFVNKPMGSLATLQNRLTVCQGYSNLNAALHRAAGLRAKVVEGLARSLNGLPLPEGSSSVPNHAWNEILIDGQWLPQDVTWDAGYLDPRTMRYVASPSSRYFDISPEDFARDHEKLKEQLN